MIIKTITKMIKKILLYIWQLPQNILGLIFHIILLRGRNPRLILEYDGIKFYIDDTMHAGISLGNKVFFGINHYIVDANYDHEYGHTRDSIYWGWLYLLIIGLPSVIHAWLYDDGYNYITQKRDYYDFWTEKRANKFGGVPNYNGRNYVRGIISKYYHDIYTS
jgi:hypothetical protein